MSCRRILVATDFSDASGAALELAGELARRYGARLTLFHAHQVPSYLYPDDMLLLPPLIAADLERSVVAELDRLAAGLSASGLAVEVRHSIGVAAVEICRAAEEVGADLVVMGSHGHSVLRHVLLGSVADKVRRSACCPVLTVHPRAATQPEAC